MKTFDFYVDQKVSAWYRTKFEVEAETYEDARKIAKEQFLNGATEYEVPMRGSVRAVWHVGCQCQEDPAASLTSSQASYYGTPDD